MTFAVRAFAGAVRAVGNATGFIRRQIEEIQRLLGFEVPFVVEIDKGKKVIKEVNFDLVKQKTLFEKIGEEIVTLNKSFKIEKEIVNSIRSGDANKFIRAIKKLKDAKDQKPTSVAE